MGLNRLKWWIAILSATLELLGILIKRNGRSGNQGLQNYSQVNVRSSSTLHFHPTVAPEIVAQVPKLRS